MQRSVAIIASVVVVLSVLTGFSGAAVAAGQDVSHTSAVDCSFPVSSVDATGTNVTVSEEPDRVVVLGPSAAQTMWEIGAKEKVVGMPVNFFTAYLNGSENRTNVVKQDGSPIAETIVGEEPDIVLAPNIVQNDTVESLRERGLTVYRFETAKSLSDVYNKTELTGRLVGNFDTAAQVSAEMDGKVSAIRSAVEGEQEPRVYYNLGGGWTAGPDSFIGQMIATAGGQNIAAGNINKSYAPLSSEIILEEDPEWIVNPAGTPLPENEGINKSTAVQADQIVSVNTNYINQPGPRNVQPLRKIAAALHPDAMEGLNLDTVETPEPTICASDVTPTPTASPTPTDSPTDSMGDDTTTQTDSPADSMADGTTGTETGTAVNGPGFSMAVTAVAVLALAVVLGRRE